MSETRTATGGTTTTDHELIRRWAEERDGVPATVRGTERGDETGMLTIDFVGYGADEEDLRHLDWDTWLHAFEDNNLAFLHQDEKTDGETSTFSRLVNRDKHDIDQPADTDPDRARTADATDAGREERAPEDDSEATASGGEGDAEHAGDAAEAAAPDDATRARGPEAGEGTGTRQGVRPGEPTTDHRAIREWVEDRGGVPATMPSPESPDADILTIDFVDVGGGNLRVTHVGWETWLQTFDDSRLAFVHEMGDADDDSSIVIRLVVRD